MRQMQNPDRDIPGQHTFPGKWMNTVKEHCKGKKISPPVNIRCEDFSLARVRSCYYLCPMSKPPRPFKPGQHVYTFGGPGVVHKVGGNMIYVRMENGHVVPFREQHVVHETFWDMLARLFNRFMK